MSLKFIAFIRIGSALCFAILAANYAHAQRPLGTDVSTFQTNIDWTFAKNNGVAFAWVKATQGTGYVNGGLNSEATGALSAGIYVGTYHYATPSVDTNITGSYSADSEATHFWNVASGYVKTGGGYLVPMLDWEDPAATNGHDGYTGYFTQAHLSQWVNEWCNDVSNDAAAKGIILRPVVYTGTWYSDPANGYPGLANSGEYCVTNWPNWMAAYPDDAVAQTGSPGDTYPWPSWDIWQYYDTNWTGGDADVYNGNFANFLQIFSTGGTNAPYFVSSPTNITVPLGANATFYAQASGEAPLNFQWSFKGTNIPGATSSNYTIVNAQLINAGGYTVSASNSYANIPSSVAFLSVLGPLTNAPDSALDPSNMVNWWTADGNPDDIYGVTNATPYGGLSYTNGEVGMAFRFDGSSAYLTTSGGEIAPPWTVCAWVYHQNAPGSSAALTGDGTYAIKLQQYGEKSYLGISHSGVCDYYIKSGLTVNAWSHLAITYSGTQIQFYINGASVGSQLYSNGVAGSVAVPTPTGFDLPRAYIGVDTFSGSPSDYALGAVDELQIYKRALAQSEIQSIYDAGSAGLVRAPQFTGVTNLGTGQVQLNLIGQTGKAITLYSTTNLLTSWTSMGSISNQFGATNYIDTTASPQKFYQATQKY